jgi:hypothetical protein
MGFSPAGTCVLVFLKGTPEAVAEIEEVVSPNTGSMISDKMEESLCLAPGNPGIGWL